MKKMRKIGAVALGCVCICMLASLSALAANLSDIEGHWAEEFIEYGVEKGYINGYDDGTFLPDKTVTRAEFSKMINNAMGITAVGTAKADFYDVVKSEWYFNEVKKAENAGYITGYEDGSFRPSNSVTRQEAAVILSRVVLPVNERADINAFADGGDVDTWATDAVTMIAAKGYIKGDENGCFLPKNSLTRSQAAKLICEFVKNENIVNKNQNVLEADKDIVYSETIFTDDIVIAPEDATALSVEFKNCRVLGNVYLKTANSVVKLENTKLKALYLDADGVHTSIDKTSEVKTSYVNYPATLVGNGFDYAVLSGDELISGTVKLSGSFDKVDVLSDAIVSLSDVDVMNVNAKVSLIVQSGTIEELNVASAAKGSTINLAKKAVVEKANNKAAVSYSGSGTIELANNEVVGVSYDESVTVTKTTGKASTTEDGDVATDSDFFDDMTITPANAKTGVLASTNISLVFDDTIYDKNGDKLDAEYVEDNFELRRTSASGTKVSFSATVYSSKNIIINPDYDLIENVKYYVVIPAGALKNLDGEKNDKYVSYFTVGEDEDEDDTNASVSFSPKSGSTISNGDTITVNFSTYVYASRSKTALTSTYCENTAFTVKKGKTSSTMEEVDFSVSSATNRQVVIKIDDTLEAGERYTVYLNSSKLYDADGDALSSASAYYTADTALTATISPANASSGVPVNPEISVEFSESVLYYNGDDLSASNAMGIIEIHKGSKTGEQVGFTVDTASTTNKKLVVIPETLTANTNYYVVVVGGSVMGKKSGEEIAETSSYFKVASGTTPVFTPTYGKSNVAVNTNITVTFPDKLYYYDTTDKKYVALTDDNIATYFASKNVVKLRLDSTTGTPIVCTPTISSDGKTVTLTPSSDLASDRDYYIVVTASTLYVPGTISGRYTPVAAATSTFSTNESLVALTPTFDPEDEEKDVLLSKKTFTIDFREDVYVPGSNYQDVTAKYLKDEVIEFYELVSGDAVPYTVKLSGTKATLTLYDEDAPTSTANVSLTGGTSYVIKVKAGTIENEDGVVNQESSTTFRTETNVSTSISSSPANGVSNVTVYVNPTITFSSPICVAYSLEDPDLEYLNEHIGIYTTSSVNENYKVDATVSISSNNKTITIMPDAPLTKNTTYYVIITASKFAYESGTVITQQQRRTFKTTNYTDCEYCYKLILTANEHAISAHPCSECGELGHEEPESEHCDECGKYGTHDEDCATLVKCTYCQGNHKDEEHECSYCQEKGHEKAENEHCSVCKSLDHTADAHCAKCESLEHTADDHCTKCGEYGHDADDHCAKCDSLDHTVDAHCAKCDSLDHIADAHCAECGELGHTADEHCSECEKYGTHDEGCTLANQNN